MGEQTTRLSREEVAKAEIGRTDVGAPLARLMAFVFLATISAVPVAQHVHDIVAYSAGERCSPWPQCYDIFRSVASSARVGARAEGSLVDRVFAANRALLADIHRYEDALQDESLLHGCVLPPAQRVLCALGVGNEKAYVGRDGWLFYRAGVDYVTGPGFLDRVRLANRARTGSEWKSPPQGDPRKAILQFKQQLDSRGIALILMPTPDKAMIHPEQLSSAYKDVGHVLQNPSFEQLRRELEGRGVLVFDVSQALVDAKRRAAQYLKTDTHWRPEAMELAAAELRRFIQERVGLPDRPPVQYVRRELEVENLGDIAVMLNLPGNQALYPKEKALIHPVFTPRNVVWDQSRSADVLFLGDSFSNVYSLESMKWGYCAGLVEQLSCELKRPLDRIIRNDDGAYATRQILSRELARGRDRLAGKRLVIWQFAVRELSAGDWKMLDMTLGEQRPTRFLTIPRGKGTIVSGVILSISRPPRPPQPYRDCLVCLHLADLETEDALLPGGEALVYMFGMRDNAWTAAARYRVGDRIRLRLTNWNDTPPGYDRLWRSPLEEPAVELEEPCWGEATEK